MGDERSEPGGSPAFTEGGGLLIGHARAGPATWVGDEDLRGIGSAEKAFLDGSRHPAGAASDVRPDPHTMYSVIVSPYVTVTPTPGFWL